MTKNIKIVLAKKMAKKITYFVIQFRSKNLIHFMNLNSLDIMKNILQQHSQKTYLLYIIDPLLDLLPFVQFKNVKNTQALNL